MYLIFKNVNLIFKSCYFNIGFISSFAGTTLSATVLKSPKESGSLMSTSIYLCPRKRRIIENSLMNANL